MFNKDLPIYNIVIDEENSLEVDMVSIVANPAMESTFLKFSKEPIKEQSLALSSDEKKELLGVALVPDKPIYREVDGKQFYVVFSKETIKSISMNLFKKGYNTKMNVEHSEEDADSFIYQSYIVDRELGVNAPKGLEDTPDGSWIIGVKVNSEKLWEDIKEGKRTGFSVEGVFGIQQIKDKLSSNKPRPMAEKVKEVNELLNELFSKNIH